MYNNGVTITHTHAPYILSLRYPRNESTTCFHHQATLLPPH